MPFNDSIASCVIHLIPANISTTLYLICNSVSDDIILGFAPVFVLIKSYASSLVGELSQLCYKGVLRTIALGSTDALNTWRCKSLVFVQPVIVPVGRIALGRIFNVLGCIIDGYITLDNSIEFNKSIFVAFTSLIESNLLDLTYAARYPNHIFTSNFNTQSHVLKATVLFATFIINTINRYQFYSSKIQILFNRYTICPNYYIRRCWCR